MARILYASSQELIDYAAERGVVVSDDDARTILNKAQDYIDTEYFFKGEAVNVDSEFPRTGLEHYADDVVPLPVKRATLYAALMLAQGVEFLEGKLADSQTKMVTIATGRITEEYATNYQDGATQSAIKLDGVTILLRKAGLLDEDMAIINMYGVRG